MASSNGIITRQNCTIADVRYTLGVSTNNLMELCKSSLVNKYSRYKPVPNNVETDTGLNRASILINALSTDISAISSNTEWQKAPLISNFRLGDFAGYNHNSTNPFTSTIGSSGDRPNFSKKVLYIPQVKVNQEDAWFFFGSRTKKKMIPVAILAIKKDTYTDTEYAWCCAPINSVPDSSTSSFNFYVGFDPATASDFQWMIPLNGAGNYRWLFSMITIDDATRLIREKKLNEELFVHVGRSFSGMLNDNDYLYFNDTTGGNGLNATYKVKNPVESLIYIEFLYPSRFANGTDQFIKYSIYQTQNPNNIAVTGTFRMNTDRPYDGVLYRTDITIPVPSTVTSSSYSIRFEYAPILTTNSVEGFNTVSTNYGSIIKNWNKYSIGSMHYCDLTLPVGKNIVIRNS